MSRPLLITALLLTALPSAALAEPLPDGANVLMVSDLHFNPFDDAALTGTLAQAPAERWATVLQEDRALPPSGTGDDSNYALLASSIAAMKSALPHPRLVLITGDFLGHAFHERFDRSTAAGLTTYEAFVDKTLAFIALQFGAAFPDVQLVPVIGNNDSWCGDYASAPHNGFLAHMAAAWAPLVNRNGAAPNFERDFAADGHYVATVPGTPLRIVVVNSVFWSRKFKPFKNRCGRSGAHPGEDELRWLQHQLAGSAQPNWIVTHIPPGLDPFATAAKGEGVSYYADKPETELIALLDKDADRVNLVIAGHTHMAGFRLSDAAAPPNDVPILISPGISPMFGNDPAFRVATVALSTGHVTDFADVALRLSADRKGERTWQVTYLLSDLHVPEVSAGAIETIRRRVASDVELRARLESAYSSNKVVEARLEAQWRLYWCAIESMTMPAFDGCFRQ